ncbi:MAG: hypothetical protein Ct9H300mP1_02680 [Planctomycetaceae bacterium]|nr:MAG: hypothetical protein Ct9H300mP1_02680 [Planctomycetaceae bacterium]
MGEMGRRPDQRQGRRDPWPQCGFVVLAGGGTKRGLVLGKTDKQAAYPVDPPVSAGDMAATIYQQLGVDPTLTGNDLQGRRSISPTGTARLGSDRVAGGTPPGLKRRRA